MTFAKPERDSALDRLEPLVGTWELELFFANAPSTGVIGRSVFEWTLDRRFLLQRMVTQDGAPESLAIIGLDPRERGGFTQHYFDERGVGRRARTCGAWSSTSS